MVEDRVDELSEQPRWNRSQAPAADPAAAAHARRALAAGPFVVHLDVDVLEFQDAPLAENVSGRGSGPTLADLGRRWGCCGAIPTASA